MTMLNRFIVPTAAFVAFALLSVAVAACGGDEESAANAEASTGGAAEFGSPAAGPRASQAKAVLHDYLAAQSAGEWKRACSYVARSARRLLIAFAGHTEQIEGETCPQIVANSNEGLSASERARLAAVRIDSVRTKGKRAFVLYADAEGAELAMPMRREAGTWRLTGTQGTSVRTPS